MISGIVSNNRRKQYQYRVAEEVFDLIEQMAQQVLTAQRDEAE